MGVNEVGDIALEPINNNISGAITGIGSSSAGFVFSSQTGGAQGTTTPIF